MFKTIINHNRYAFCEGFEDWKDAVRSACALLAQDGTVPEEYATEVIRNVEEYGPYIVLMPGFAMPHAMVEGVKESAVAFLKTERPVSFTENDSDKQASIFLAIAANDAEKHLQNIQMISSILEDAEVLELLYASKNVEDLEQVQRVIASKNITL